MSPKLRRASASSTQDETFTDSSPVRVRTTSPVAPIQSPRDRRAELGEVARSTPPPRTAGWPRSSPGGCRTPPCPSPAAASSRPATDTTTPVLAAGRQIGEAGRQRGRGGVALEAVGDVGHGRSSAYRWLRPKMMRRPSRVSQGSWCSMVDVYGPMSPARPPVATTVHGPISSSQPPAQSVHLGREAVDDARPAPTRRCSWPARCEARPARRGAGGRPGPTGPPERSRCPGTMMPPRYSPLAETTSKVVAVPKSTTMVGPAVALEGGHGVGDAVGADLLGVVVVDRHPGAHPGFDDDRLHLEPPVAHLPQRRPQPGHDRRHRDAGDGLGGIEALELEELVDAAAPSRRRCETPPWRCASGAAARRCCRPARRRGAYSPMTVWVLPTSMATST